jgi:hypothetical protein
MAFFHILYKYFLRILGEAWLLFLQSFLELEDQEHLNMDPDYEPIRNRTWNPGWLTETIFLMEKRVINFKIY